MTDEVDYTALQPGDMLAAVRDDAFKWATAFCQHAEKLGHHDIDHGWMIGWFANAIEHSGDVRRWAREAAHLAAGEAGEGAAETILRRPSPVLQKAIAGYYDDMAKQWEAMHAKEPFAGWGEAALHARGMAERHRANVTLTVEIIPSPTPAAAVPPAGAMPPGLSVKAGDDGTWLCFKASDGYQTMIRLESLGTGRIACTTIKNWCADFRTLGGPANG